MCGCNKRRGSTSVRRRTFRPSVGPRSLGVQNGATPDQLRAQGLLTAQSVGQSKRMDSNRRKVEKLRRDAIRRRLGR
jgi:hypothetical protein